MAKGRFCYALEKFLMVVPSPIRKAVSETLHPGIMLGGRDDAHEQLLRANLTFPKSAVKPPRELQAQSSAVGKCVLTFYHG
jgi:hypothetical protein